MEVSWALRLSAKTAFLDVEEALWGSACLEEATVVHEDAEADVPGRESSSMVV